MTSSYIRFGSGPPTARVVGSHVPPPKAVHRLILPPSRFPRVSSRRKFPPAIYSSPLDLPECCLVSFLCPTEDNPCVRKYAWTREYNTFSSPLAAPPPPIRKAIPKALSHKRSARQFSLALTRSPAPQALSPERSSDCRHPFLTNWCPRSRFSAITCPPLFASPLDQGLPI